MPRPSNTTERRAQIVGGLMRVMAMTGYERASIKQIAAEAGVASGIVHYHFGSKLEILVALVDELSKRVRERYAAAGAKTPKKKLYALIDAHLALGDGASPQAVAAWVAVGAEAIGHAEVREVYAKQLGETRSELERLLVACAPHRGKDPGWSRNGAAALLAAIAGAYQLSAAAPGALPEGYAAPAVRLLADALLE